MKSGKKVVGQADEEAMKSNDKQGTKILEFCLLRLWRLPFYGDEKMKKILNLFGELERKRKLIETLRSD